MNGDAQNSSCSSQTPSLTSFMIIWYGGIRHVVLIELSYMTPKICKKKRNENLLEYDESFMKRKTKIAKFGPLLWECFCNVCTFIDFDLEGVADSLLQKVLIELHTYRNSHSLLCNINTWLNECFKVPYHYLFSLLNVDRDN